MSLKRSVTSQVLACMFSLNKFRGTDEYEDHLSTAAKEEPTIVDEPYLVLHAGDICYVVDPP